MKKILNSNWAILIVLLFSVIPILPFFHPGFFPMHDDTQPSRVFEMAQSLRDGMFPVRWVKDLGYGYGYSIFNFYAPLPYYIGGLLHLVGIDVIVATKVMMAIPIFIAGITMFLFAREFLGKIGALVSSIIFLFFPYFALNLFVRGAVGEAWAYSFLPLVFLGIFKLYGQKTVSIKWILFTSVAISLVTLSHNLSAYMLILLWLILIIILLVFSKYKVHLVQNVFAVVFLTFLLSAFYTIPAIFEMSYTNVSSQIGGGANFQDHFVCLGQLWNSQWGYGGSTSGCIDGMSFKLGKSNVVFSVLSIILGIYLFIKRKEKKDIPFFSSVVLLLFTLFMTLSYSVMVWSSVAYIEYLQYPWRFLNFAGFFIAFLVGYGVCVVAKLTNLKITVVFCLLIVTITIYINAKHFQPQAYNQKTPKDYTNEKTLRFNISKISDEYMPRGFQKPENALFTPQNSERLVLLNLWSRGSLSIIENKTQYVAAKVKTEKEANIRANIAYFPAWKAYIDKKRVDYKVTDGPLILTVESGLHFVEFKFEQTPVERWANALSLVGIGILLVGIIRIYGKKTS